MTDKQKSFLNDLAELLRKYHISQMLPGNSEISFYSNISVLKIANYSKGNFHYVTSTIEEYKPEASQQ